MTAQVKVYAEPRTIHETAIWNAAIDAAIKRCDEIALKDWRAAADADCGCGTNYSLLRFDGANECRTALEALKVSNNT